MITAAYGSWPSSITAATLTAGNVVVESPALDGTDLYWLERHAAQGGRIGLWRLPGAIGPDRSDTDRSDTDRSDTDRSDSDRSDAGRADSDRSDAGRAGEAEELTPAPTYVRSRVHEYGGGAYAVADGIVVWSDFPGGRLVRRDPDGTLSELTAPGPWRFADLRLHPERNLVLAVREDHSDPSAEAVNTIVALRLDGPNDDGGTVVCSGHDFYASPALSGDGVLAWTEWDHPDMPWSATRICVGTFDGGALSDVAVVAGSAGDRSDTEDGSPAGDGARRESALHPVWLADGQLLHLSDRTGWWNLYLWQRSPVDDPGAPAGTVQELHRKDAEFCDAPWMLGDRPYAVIDEDHVLCRWQHDGWAHLGVLTVSTGVLAEIDGPAARYRAVAAGGGVGCVIRSGPTQTTELGLIEVADAAVARGDAAPANGAPADSWQSLRTTGTAPPVEQISEPQAVSWTSDGEQVHGWYYPPAHPDHRAPEGELPPLMTVSHGGPTDFSAPEFTFGLQFFTSRGIAVLDVNYRGSTGYGRAYRERLDHNWGLVDVADCASGALAMAERGLADPRRLAIRGGSAGGYTTLRALTSTDVFTAGVSYYGIGDLELLARDTHKFEARYLDGLIGPYPEDAARYRELSPIHEVDRLSAPILLLQGEEDAVVPPNQAETMAEAARRKGLPVALVMFPGEGHGFRAAENQRRAYEAELAFLGRVFGFTPADELPPLTIENLPG